MLLNFCVTHCYSQFELKVPSITSPGIVTRKHYSKQPDSNNPHSSLFCKMNVGTVCVDLYVRRLHYLLVKARRGQSPVQCFVARGVLGAQRLCFSGSDKLWYSVWTYFSKFKSLNSSGNWIWQNLLVVTLCMLTDSTRTSAVQYPVFNWLDACCNCFSIMLCAHAATYFDAEAA